MAQGLQGSLASTTASVPEATAQASSYCSLPSLSNALAGIGVSRSSSGRARQSYCRGQLSVTFAQSLNSDNGSAYSCRPDPEPHQHDPNSNIPMKSTDPSPLEGSGSMVPEPGDNGRDRWNEPLGTLGSPVAKQLTQSFVDESHTSLEGLQFSDEQEKERSLMSFAGGYDEKDDASLRTTTTKDDPQEEASDSLWRSVFPAYMRSKEEELCGDAETCLDDLGKGHGVGGAAAARAAAAAAASAMELENRTSAFATPIPPSVAAPLASSAQNRVEGGRNLRDLITNDPIWAAMRAEARLEAEREPLLSSFLYASILAHPCFERSLGFVLANRLKNATLLATQLLDVFDDVFMHDANIRQAVRLDVQAVKDRDPSCRSYSSALLYLKGYHALQSYRVAHALWNRGQSVLALALQSRISEVFAVDIHPAARIGKAILLDHGTGVVIGETAVVGDRVSMLQGVTLGGTGKVAGDRHPKIGEGVLIGAGATILGNITVGRGAMVAAGSLVLKDVPPHSMVAGTPAKVVGVLEEPSPSLTMKHDVTKDLLDSFGNDSFCGGMGI